VRGLVQYVALAYLGLRRSRRRPFVSSTLKLALARSLASATENLSGANGHLHESLFGLFPIRRHKISSKKNRKEEDFPRTVEQLTVNDATGEVTVAVVN
jgi:hypothetical protein